MSGLTGGSGLLTQTSVGEINGKSVDARLFQQAVSQATEDRQRQSPEPLGIASAAQIRDQVWEQFVQETILEEEYRRWGISVSSDEIAAVIRSQPLPQLQAEPQFQTDGQFDQAKWERWLASASGQQFIPLLENQYRTSLLQAKLARHVVAPLYLSDTELWERFKDQRETARFALVTIDPQQAVTDDAVPVTPTEVQEYYRAHRSELEREATAWLSYISMDRRPIASDSAAAMARANQLREEILSGTPFAEVAQRESSDTISGRQGGDLGTWGKGSFDADFEKAAWSIPLNSVSQPIATQFGYHLIQITKRSADSATGRHILIPIEVTGDHRDQLDARADSLENLAAERLDPAALDTAARALGLSIRTSGAVVKNRFSNLPPDAQVWAFQARPGEHSPVIETPTDYVVARLDSVRDAGIPRLEAIRGEVEALVRAQKKQAKARELAQQIRERAAAQGGTLEAAAKAANLPYNTIGPVTRINAPLNGGQAIGRAFGLEPAEIAGPVDGRGVVYVMQGIERSAADSAEFVKELSELRQRALDNMRQIHLRQYLAALRTNADIVDERDQIYKTAAQVEAEAPVVPGSRP